MINNMKNKKLFITIIIPLLLTLNLFPSIQSNNYCRKEIIPKGGFTKKIYEINAASSFEYGLKIGEKYRFKYKFLDFFTRYLKTTDENKKDINKQLRSLEKYYPEYIEELNGLSASTNIKLERLIEIQILLSNFFGGNCVVTLSTGPATKNNQTFVSQNWDVAAYSYSKYLVSLYTFMPHIRRIGTNYRYVYLGIPILDEIFLMNEKNV